MVTYCHVFLYKKWSRIEILGPSGGLFFCGNFFHYGKAVSLILRIFYHAYMSISMKMAVMNSHMTKIEILAL